MTAPDERAVALADDAVRYAALSRVIDAIATGPLAGPAAATAMAWAEAAVSQAGRLAAEPDAHTPWLHEEPRR